MTTTFLSREAVRDELATLFTADGSWQSVFKFFPGLDAIKGRTPVLIIISRGTEQGMAGLETNPTTYRFLLSSWVLAFSPLSADNWTSTDAEDKKDELDMKLRQVIRDNAGGGTNADLYRFEPGFSQVDDVIIEGVPYVVETRAILAGLKRGAI